MSIAELIEAVEAGTIARHDLDAFIPVLGLTTEANNALDAYRGSLDAAKALHEALLPNRYWIISEFDGAWTAQIPVSDHKTYEATDEHSAARAWLLAILRAKEAGQ